MGSWGKFRSPGDRDGPPRGPRGSRRTSRGCHGATGLI